MTPGRIISIINHKGGVGKTTTAVSLGEALSREGLRVLVVDLDPQCNTTDMLLPGRHFEYTAFDVLNPEQENLDPACCMQETHIPELHCLPNRPDSIYLEPQLIRMGPAGFQLFRDRLGAYLRSTYHVTLIDNPPNLGTFTASSLLASDWVIIPCDAGSAGSLRGFSKALGFIDEIRDNGNPQLRFLKALITRVDRRTSVWKTIIDRKTEELGEDWVFGTVIPMNTDFQKAEFSDRTIFQIRPGAPGAVAYRNLARELLTALDLKLPVYDADVTEWRHKHE
jgi:cellulose biosynthesis protein BcsQ